MRYSYLVPEESTGKWYDLEYVTDIAKDAVVFGDIRKKNLRNTDSSLICEEKEWVIEPFANKKGIFTKQKGYVLCQSEAGTQGYVRILLPDYTKCIALLVAIVLVVGGAFGYIYYQNKVRVSQTEKLEVFTAPGDMVNDDPSQVAIPAYDKIYMNENTQKITSPLMNIEGNKCLLGYKIYLAKDNELIFSSKSQKLMPGKAWYGFKTDKKMAKGNYKVYVVVTGYSLKDKDKAINSGKIESELVVK